MSVVTEEEEHLQDWGEEDKDGVYFELISCFTHALKRHYKWETAMTCSWEEIIKNQQQTTSYDEHTMLNHNGKEKLQMHNVNSEERARDGDRRAAELTHQATSYLPARI